MSTLRKIHTVAHAIFETTRSKFTQILYHCPVSWKINPLYFFSSNLIYFLQKKATEVQVFRLPTARVKIHRISYVTFRTKSQFSFKVWTTLQCNVRSFFCTFLAETLYALDKSNTSMCKFPDLQLLKLNFTKFLMSFFKPKVNVSSKLSITLQWHEA